nr:GyrI-like domain-containing protein [Propionibacterium sp.]
MTAIHEPEVVALEPQPAALLRETVRMDALPDFFDRAFHAAARVAGAQGVQLVGPPVGVYFGMPSETVEVGAGFPTDRPVTPDAGVQPFTLPGGRAVQVLHVGTYDALQETYGRLMAWVGAQQLTPGPLMWEAYLNEPDPNAPEATRTLIVWPLA